MYVYNPQGVCSKKMEIELDANNKIEEIKIFGGCQGNLTGIASLCKGQDAKEVIERLQGITCGSRLTSCPDQLSIALKQALENNI